MNIEQPLTDVVVEQSENDVAATRSLLYGLLAQAFSHPEGAQLIRLLDGDLLADIANALDALPMGIEVPTLSEVPNGVDPIRDTQGVFSDLFEVTSGSPRVSLLERRYGETPEQQLWEDLLRYYKHFGLDFSSGLANEQPDHLLTELSFMHYLCFLEAGAKGGQDSYQRGQRDFLANHLAKWTGKFAEKFDVIEQSGPYASLAKLLAQVTKVDLALLNAELEL